MHGAADHATVFFTSAEIELGQPIPDGELVVVKKGDPLSAGFADAAISRRNNSFLRLIDATEWMFRFGGRCRDYFLRLVGRAIIDYEDFVVESVLGQVVQTRQCSAQHWGAVLR